MGDRGEKTYEEILLQVIEDAHGLILAAEDVGKRLLGHAAVLELAEHQLVVACQQRAAGVAIVRGLERPTLSRRQQVVHEHGRLRRDRRRRLAVRQARRVAYREHVLVLGVLCRRLVDVDPACCVGCFLLYTCKHTRSRMCLAANG